MARSAPAVEAAGDAVPRPVALWQIAPGNSRLCNPAHPVDHPTMVVGRAARFPGALRWHEGLKPFPLLISKFVPWSGLVLLRILLAHPSNLSPFANTP